MTLSDAFDVLERIQASKAKNTVAQTKSILKHLRPFFDKIELSEFERDYEEIWSTYIAYIGGKHRLTHDRRYLVMALKKAGRKGWIAKQFIKSDFALKESHQPIGRALSKEEVKRLLESAKKHERTYLQILMAIYMGMRISEILQLRVEEVDLESGGINLDAQRLKTRQPRKVPIPIVNLVRPLLEQYVKAAPGRYVFPSIQHGQILPDKPQRDNNFHWTKIRAESGVKCRFHDLRHTAISFHLARGMPMTEAVKYFGATPQVIERIYHHINPESNDAFRNATFGGDEP